MDRHARALNQCTGMLTHDLAGRIAAVFRDAAKPLYLIARFLAARLSSGRGLIIHAQGAAERKVP